jgi:hypothetical protein
VRTALKFFGSGTGFCAERSEAAIGAANAEAMTACLFMTSSTVWLAELADVTAASHLGLRLLRFGDRDAVRCDVPTNPGSASFVSLQSSLC